MHGSKSEGRAEGSVFAEKEFRFCCRLCLQAEILKKSWVFALSLFACWEMRGMEVAKIGSGRMLRLCDCPSL